MIADLVKTFLAGFGAVFMSVWLLGVFGVIDFRVCVADPGQCRVVIVK